MLAADVGNPSAAFRLMRRPQNLLLAVPLCAQAGRAYVTNEDGESVSVLDTDKAELVATVNVGKRPRGLKVSRDGARLYVAFG